MDLHRAIGLHAYAKPLVGIAKGVQSSLSRVNDTPSGTRYDGPHREPNARLAMLPTILVTAAKYKLLEESSDNIYDGESRRDPDERKREFLGLEQLVDPRQCLVNVDLATIGQDPK